MIHLARIGVPVILTIIALTCLRADDKPAAERVAHAQAFVATLMKGDFAAARKDFDEAMLKALSVEGLETLWKSITTSAGAFKQQTATRTAKVDKYDIVVVTCAFEKKALDLRVVYDADNKITGFAIKPVFEYKPPPYAKEDTYHERELSIPTGEGALPGTLTLPTGDGSFPAVVLVHGSGPNDRDETIGPNKILRDLAWGLASRGVAVLRYEKRTLVMRHKWAKAPDDLTLKEETVEDAVTAVALLGKQKEIDKKRIFVLGHSAGAFAAPRIGQAAPDAAGLILLAGNSRPLEDLILEQYTYILSLGDLSPEQQQEQLAVIKKQVERVKDPKLSADTPAKELPLGVPAAYWLDLRQYDPMATALKIKKPMLLLQGERDYQVTLADFDGWKKALGERKDVQMKSYPKLNHLFMAGEGKSKPAEYEQAGHVAQEVIDDIAEWIKKQD